jgi:hypothetical protein
MERLEDRRLMAGDVRAEIINGTLFLNEEFGHKNGAQAVQVSQLDNGKIRVAGMFSTTGGRTKINGLDFVDFAHPSDMTISLLGGKDEILVTRATFDDIRIIAGGGSDPAADNDVVVIDHVRTTGSMSVNTSHGQDEVTVWFSTIGNSAGADDLTINSGVAGVTSGTDADRVVIQSSAVFGKTAVNTGGSSDYVGIQRSNFGDSSTDVVLIDAGAGADTVELGVATRPGQIAGPVKLASSMTVLGDSFADSDAASGADAVRMFSVFAGVDIAVNLRTGNDRLEMTNVDARFVALHGEKGSDTMVLVEVDARETLFALMGGDDDLLDLAACRPHQLAVDGGAGANDRLVTFDMTNVPTIKSGFEVINGKRVLQKALQPGVNSANLSTLQRL